MFSRSHTALGRRLPPFAVFFKSMSPVLTTAATPQRMRVASVLWRKTAPHYGIRYSASRVAAAKQIYRKEGSSLMKLVKPATAKPARRTHKSRAVRRSRKASSSSAPATPAKVNKRESSRGNSKKMTKTRRASPTKTNTPYASFKAKVMNQAKLASTPTNRSRVFRMWLLTGQQRSLSMSKRVLMAVRLLTKDQKSKRRLSKKVRKTKKTTKRNTKGRRSSAKKRKAAKTHKATRKSGGAAKAVQKKKKSESKSRKVRFASRKKVIKPRVLKVAAAQRKSFNTKAEAKARKSTASRAAAITKKQQPRNSKATARKQKVNSSRKVRKAAAKPKARRAVSKKRQHNSRANRRHENPYIDFYRRVRMTGLLPNSPVVVGSRKIKDLWARTHALPNIDDRVAEATRILEAQTGRKAMSVTTPALETTPSAVVLKDIKVPSYYKQNPFGATYAALLPALQDIPSSTRMAHVAKAWTNTALKDDHRSPKERIAAVAHELKK